MVFETVIVQAIMDGFKEKVDLVLSYPHQGTAPVAPSGQAAVHQDPSAYTLADASDGSNASAFHCTAPKGCPGAYDSAKAEWHCCPVNPSDADSTVAATQLSGADSWKITWNPEFYWNSQPGNAPHPADPLPTPPAPSTSAAASTVSTQLLAAANANPVPGASALAHTTAPTISWSWNGEPLSSYASNTDAPWGGWAANPGGTAPPPVAEMSAASAAAAAASAAAAAAAGHHAHAHAAAAQQLAAPGDGGAADGPFNPLVTDAAAAADAAAGGGFESPGDACCDPWCTAWCKEPYSVLAADAGGADAAAAGGAAAPAAVVECPGTYHFGALTVNCQAGTEVAQTASGEYQVGDMTVNVTVIDDAAAAPACPPAPQWAAAGGPRCGGRSRAARPSAGHLVMAGEAMLYGAVCASARLARAALSGAAGAEAALERWDADFRRTAGEAADSVTPVGGYILRHHVLPPHPAPAAAAAAADPPTAGMLVAF